MKVGDQYWRKLTEPDFAGKFIFRAFKVKKSPQPGLKIQRDTTVRWNN